MKKYILALMMLSGQALAQSPTENEINHSYAICQNHRGPGTGAPGQLLNWEHGYEDCETIAAAWRKTQAAKDAAKKTEDELKNRIKNTADKLKGN